ncbi:MAG: SUMF1/EgtB/PvdO family nonheme iron enzyme [Planctomycetes bacterium]|nr:SUMF1/EgtB/PvdO family nonheme iron enzyme [Planctomycetota bacterium]
MSDDPLLNKGELGPYRIERKLGQGAMGGVYLGMHRVLEVHHAIKVVHPKLLGDGTLVERFLREARNTAKMKHMNIVQVVGADQVEGMYYLAMEFVAGKTLEQLMRHPGLSVHDAVRYTHMIANALNYAHSRNIIHRDIKPANIMVNEDDVAKLMDFGLVRDQGAPDAPDTGEQLTMAGYIMGTPQYMPLEQWQGEGVDHRSDIYALGATLYVELTGKLPFPGKNAREIFRNVLTISAKDVREHNSEIDEQLAQIVHRAMAPEKEDRFQSAGEFALALEQWWDRHPYQGTSLFKAPVIDETRGISGSTRAPTTATRAVLTHSATLEGSSPTAMGARKGSAPLIAVVALLVVVVGVIVALFAFQGGEQPLPPSPTPPPAPEFSVAIDADKATEALPLAVTSADFSIPGKGSVTVNGAPYKFGSALSLSPGLNKLLVASTEGASERTLFVIFDNMKPVVEVPLLEGWPDNLVPTSKSSFKLAGSVSDAGCGLRDLKLTLLIDGEERSLVVNSAGEFERDIPVADADVTLELQAEDRAGNRSAALTFWVVPDRASLRFDFDKPWKPEGRWVASKQFELTGRINKSRGAKVTVDGKEVVLPADGAFAATVTREPGAHEIAIVATDWFGSRLDFTKRVFVDLEAPAITLGGPAPGTIRVEKLPAKIDVQGRVDDPNDAVLTVNGKSVVLVDGNFSTSVNAAEFGDFTIIVEVKDPNGRGGSVEVSVRIEQIKYRPLAKNRQGYQEYERVSDGMTMVLIPGGEFTRGSGRIMPDAPDAKIELSSFLIAKYEVTNAQFVTFLNADAVTADAAVSTRRWLVRNADGFLTGLNFNGTQWEVAPGEGSRPVVGITWTGADAYCRWADSDGGSLPSEAQWEYAARGADGRTYPWGNELPDSARANCEITGRDKPSEVTKQEEGESPFGLRNMAGNVEEWCLDWYEEGSYLLPGQGGKDPVRATKPDAVDRRVVRGGSVLSPVVREPKPTGDEDPSHLQAFARARRLPNTGANDRGFRPVAKPPNE